MTPLQEALGFEVSEGEYDKLSFRDQLILDLKIAGWSNKRVGVALGIGESTVSVAFKQVRYALANSKIHETMMIRTLAKEEQRKEDSPQNNWMPDEI